MFLNLEILTSLRKTKLKRKGKQAKFFLNHPLVIVENHKLASILTEQPEKSKKGKKAKKS